MAVQVCSRAMSPILLFIVFLKLYTLQLATGAFRSLISGGGSRCSWVSSRALGQMERDKTSSSVADCNAGGGCKQQTPVSCHIQHLQMRGSHGSRIQTNSFCTAFIESLPKIGERSFLKNTVTHRVGRGFTTMQ